MVVGPGLVRGSQEGGSPTHAAGYTTASLHQMSDAGLAIGPGHTEESKLPRGITEERCGDLCQSTTRIDNHCSRWCFTTLFGKNGDGACSHRIGNKAPSIQRVAGDGDKQGARTNLTRIFSDLLHFYGGIAPGLDNR